MIVNGKLLWMRYREPTRILMVMCVKNLQTELMAEIYSKSLVRAGKVFLMKFS